MKRSPPKQHQKPTLFIGCLALLFALGSVITNGHIHIDDHKGYACHNDQACNNYSNRCDNDNPDVLADTQSEETVHTCTICLLADFVPAVFTPQFNTIATVCQHSGSAALPTPVHAHTFGLALARAPPLC